MVNWNLDDLVEKVIEDLGGKVPDYRIREVVLDLASGYQDATVQTFVPILIRRQAVERLQAESRAILSNSGNANP